VPLSFLPQSVAHALAAQPAGAGAYAVVAVLLLAAYLPGRALAGGAPFASRAERITICLALGLVAEATLGFALGLAGWFKLGAATAGLALLQLPALRPRRRWHEARSSSGLTQLSPGVWGIAVAAAVALGLLGALLATRALYPPLGFDSTMYHLPAARELVDTGRLPWLPDSRFPVFPQLNELLFALALLGGDDRAARCLELAAAALVALGVYAWTAGQSVRRARSRPGAGSGGWAGAWPGVWAAALWLGSPYVGLFGADAYVDVGLALFGFLAVLAADRWGATGHPRWAAVAGGLAGAAAGVKYQGLFFVVLVPLAILVPALGGACAWDRRLRARAAALALGAALLAAAPWYGRVLYTTGNPVFPFFPEVFGGSDWDPAPAFGGPAAATGGMTLRSLAVGGGGALAHWPGPPPFNPWLLALAPSGLLLLRRPRAAAGTVLLGLAYAPCSWLFAPDPRYLLPALPWAAAAVALGLGRLAAGLGLDRPAGSGPARGRGLVAAAGLAAALAFAAPGAVYAGYWIARLGPVPRGAEAREGFLGLRRPGYAAIAGLNRRHAAGYAVYAYAAPDLRYFVRGRLLGDVTGPNRYGRLLPELRSAPEAAAATLREWGADYLLLVEPRAPTARRGGAGRALELPWRPVYEDVSSRLYDLRSRSLGSGGAPSPLGHRDAQRRGREGGGSG
jgi:hypothetical protein